MASGGSLKQMFSNMAATGGGSSSNTNGSGDGHPAASSKRVSLERVYQKKSQLEHILLRPDTYIGSVEPLADNMYVYDEQRGMHQREITYVPGLYKIFDEILVNAADNKQRDPSMDAIKVDIDCDNNTISICNNGKGIPVAMHKTEKMYVPTMIFGHLLTSSNYNDEEQKVTGGRNGYGAKLCNIFSTRFVVETASKEFKSSFKQIWSNNMSKTSEPKVKEFSGADFTKVTFSPDLSKFKMERLDDDIVALLSRRAYDIAASTRGVKVFLNGKRLPVKTFKDYVDLYLKDKKGDDDTQLKCVYENCGPRWEVAVAISDKGFQQVSFVNSIATTKGGRHVDHVTDLIIKQLIETIKKKNKGGIQVKPFQIKNHLWVFVNCLVVNPTFDSQTKENMTLQSKSFGSKCTVSDKFIGQVNKCGIVESVMAWAKFKAQSQLNTKCSSKKQTRLHGIPKLEDANDAGTRNSQHCTLILTEGDSAKALAVSGLGVVGRDRFGVFPLKGKPLNVREASHKQILENAEINNVIKILGLQYKKKYDTDDDLKTLRYGRLMIMADQDQDGSHIKGLLINFLHYNWPTLLRQSFLEQFITPIVRVTKGKEVLSFFTLPEFEEWKRNTPGFTSWRAKYYKGLGTSTSVDAKGYFSNMTRHRIRFKYEGDAADRAITMAFSKKCVDERKEWLTNWMQDCRRRRELGLPEVYLYEKDTSRVNYSDFINKELVLFSNMDNERSIPSLVDGLKPGQRKVLFTCFLRKDSREVKVAQLVGAVSEKSAYHHGEASLASTIINMAQNFVGTNNINLLLPLGQFGTRLQGGKDAASPRYIQTKLNAVTKALFPEADMPLLKRQFDDNLPIEPEWYLPILPTVLVNGADGIGTGWMTRIANYNPRQLVTNIRRMLDGADPEPLHPWYRGFSGEIMQLSSQQYMLNGEVAVLSANQVEITELPVKTWTQPYKEMLSSMVLPEKGTPQITDFKEYHTDLTVKFVVSMTEDKLIEAEQKGLHSFFKLQSTYSTSSMVLFDHMGVLKRYNSVEEIQREFFTLRLEYYGKRKAYLMGLLGAECAKLSNQARFILEKCDGKLVIENKKRRDMVAELVKKGFDADPVKAWKVSQQQDGPEEPTMSQDEDEETAGVEGEGGAVSVSSQEADYDYLLGMKLWSLTRERKEELLKKRDDKMTEVENVRALQPADMWRRDLDHFLAVLGEWEKHEKEEMESAAKKSSKQKAGSSAAYRKNVKADEFMPSASARRVAPVLSADQKKKAEAAIVKKETGGVRKRKPAAVSADNGEQGAGVKSSKAATSSADGLKQSTLNFGKHSPTKKRPGKELWETDSDEDDSLPSDMDDSATAQAVASPVRQNRRTAASKVNYRMVDGGDSDNDAAASGGESSDPELFDNPAVREPDHVVTVDEHLDDSLPAHASKPTADARKRGVIAVSDTDSEFDRSNSPVNASASDMFDSMMDGGSSATPARVYVKPGPASKKNQPADARSKPCPASKKPATTAAKSKPCPASKKPSATSKKSAAAVKRKTAVKRDHSDSDDFSPAGVNAAKKTASGRARALKGDDQSSSEDEDEPYVPLHKRATERSRAVKTNQIDSDSSE